MCLDEVLKPKNRQINYLLITVGESASLGYCHQFPIQPVNSTARNHSLPAASRPLSGYNSQSHRPTERASALYN